MNPIKVGIVGTGSIGRNHARVFSELAGTAFTAIFDTHRATAQEMAAKFGVKPAASLEEFAGMIDAATIATPTATHFEIARFLLERGKSVLVEKPITENTADARALASLAASRGLVLQVGHIERFNPVLGALEARLSQPRFIEASRLSVYPGRSIDIGVVLDLMIHDLEIILHLVRSPVQRIDAVGVPVLSRGEDIANVRLRFANGCVANVTASRISQDKLRKIRVFQQDAYLSLDYQKQEGYLLRVAREDEKESSLLGKLLGVAADATIVTEFAGRRIVREPVAVEKAEPLQRELAAFLECVRAGAQPKVSGREATAALELALEITRLIEEPPREPVQ
ncbi:MAG: Gfo/Idh/MocA family oxidoreductase [Verrucomicrobiota bacterium]|nr:Gfo/Idh/MocA family oxidoreductase [Verrucomicrobiota bacterium]